MSDASITLVTAVSAAVIALAGLSWQIWSWRRGRASVIKIEVTPLVNDEVSMWIVLCRCINLSNHNIYIRSVLIRPDDDSSRDIRMSLFKDEGNDDDSELLKPHKDKLYYIPGEPYARAFGNLDYVPVVVITADGRSFRHAGRDLTMKAALLATFVDRAIENAEAGIKNKNGVIAEISDDEFNELLPAKRTEWLVRSLESSGFATVEENDDGTIARFMITEEGITAYERTRVSIADDAEHPLRATLKHPLGRYSKMGRAVRRAQKRSR